MKLSDAGELRAVELLISRLPSRADVAVGAGDDCAVVRTRSGKWDFLLTSDPVIAGVHFESSLRPERAGWKAACRVISDIAAMGGEPLWMLVNIAAPPDMGMNAVMGIRRGAAQAARRFGMAIVGGDLSQSGELQIHVFGVGRVPRERAVLRSGASAGDGIYVTGALGGSILGRHASFVPRVREGIFLRRWASAMMDISDGLAADLMRLAVASGTGAIVDAPAIPVSASARRMRDGRSAIAHAVEDGEDFELLFTVPETRSALFEKAWRRAFSLRCTRIGAMTDRTGVIIYRNADGKELSATFRGFTHFSGKRRT